MQGSQNPFKTERFGNLKRENKASSEDLRYHAEVHEAKRQRVIASILLDLYLMAAKKMFTPGTSVKLQRAVAHDPDGGRGETFEIAHCVPQQIILGTRLPQDILRLKSPDQAGELDSFFTESDYLPANYNEADSRAEDYGLREGFRFACQTSVFIAQTNNSMNFESVAVAVKTAYALYETRAGAAFEIALKELRDKFTFRLPPKEDKKYREQIEITRIYDQTMRRSSGAAEVLDVQHIKNIIKIYEKIG